MEFQQVNTIQSNTHLRQLVDDHIPTITSAVSLTLVAFENLLRGAWWWYAFVLREKNVRWDWLDCFCWTSLMPNMTSPHFSLPPSKEEIKNDFALFKISFFFYETKVVITSKKEVYLCTTKYWVFACCFCEFFYN